jgi:hypothetical protein
LLLAFFGGFFGDGVGVNDVFFGEFGVGFDDEVLHQSG